MDREAAKKGQTEKARARNIRLIFGVELTPGTRENRTMASLPYKLRESAATLARQQTHELPVMIGFCSRLRQELRTAADEIERLQETIRRLEAHAVRETSG